MATSMKAESREVLRALYNTLQRAIQVQSYEKGPAYYVDRELNLVGSPLLSWRYGKDILDPMIQQFNMNCKLQDVVPAIMAQEFRMEDIANKKIECINGRLIKTD
jgi:hypothetical protein